VRAVSARSAAPQWCRERQKLRLPGAELEGSDMLGVHPTTSVVWTDDVHVGGRDRARGMKMSDSMQIPIRRRGSQPSRG
jgi:hypothetical protein